jgi:hypothetical protein
MSADTTGSRLELGPIFIGGLSSISSNFNLISSVFYRLKNGSGDKRLLKVTPDWHTPVQLSGVLTVKPCHKLTECD